MGRGWGKSLGKGLENMDIDININIYFNKSVLLIAAAPNIPIISRKYPGNIPMVSRYPDHFPGSGNFKPFWFFMDRRRSINRSMYGGARRGRPALPEGGNGARMGMWECWGRRAEREGGISLPWDVLSLFGLGKISGMGFFGHWDIPGMAPECHWNVIPNPERDNEGITETARE